MAKVTETNAALRTDPSAFKVGKLSSARLSEATGIDTGKLAGKSVAELAKLFPFEIDPVLFLMRRICGRVVKTDPATGIDYPVPFATVQVEDTDCSFLSYFPPRSPWVWHFPFGCRREVIATVKTDACGNFCVWVPRFDIDHVWRWRRHRICFPIIFERPSLIDIVDHFIPREVPDFPIGPNPGPDPAPFTRITRGELVSKIAASFGPHAGMRLEKLAGPMTLGASTQEAEHAQVAPALLDAIAPPLPPELRLTEDQPKKSDKGDARLSTIAHRLAIDPRDIGNVDLRRWIGPFKRCIDIVVREWTTILDVPDITFRVLQDTNGDGVEEQIYGESHFQVRWNSGPLGNVTLHAGPNAIAAPQCGVDQIACGNTPAIVMAGRLPVTGDPSVYDTSSGYALRMNRPHPSGQFNDPTPTIPAVSPLKGLLSLFGCNKTDPNATHYRLTYEYSGNGGASYSARTPFVGLTWPLYRLNGAGIGEWHFATADSLGWYPLALPAGPNAWLPQDLLLDWPSGSMPDGLYSVRLELGTAGATSPSTSSADVRFRVDNSAPRGLFTVGYSASPSGPFTPLDQICPVVRRGATPHDMFFEVMLDASAAHMRSARMWASGCGDGEFAFETGSGGYHSGGTTYEHWHDSVGDNSQTMRAVYRLPSGSREGTYSFGAHVVSRAFNPWDGNHLTSPPWTGDTVESEIWPSVAFSVFDANP